MVDQIVFEIEIDLSGSIGYMLGYTNSVTSLTHSICAKMHSHAQTANLFVCICLRVTDDTVYGCLCIGACLIGVCITLNGVFAQCSSGSAHQSVATCQVGNWSRIRPFGIDSGSCDWFPRGPDDRPIPLASCQHAQSHTLSPEKEGEREKSEWK